MIFRRKVSSGAGFK